MSTELDAAEIAVADEAFSHGSTYPPPNGQVRRKTCKSCAFVNSPESVRPENVSVEALERATADSLGRLHGEIGVGVVPFPRLGALGGFETGPGKVVEQMRAALRRRLAAAARREGAP